MKIPRLLCQAVFASLAASLVLPAGAAVRLSVTQDIKSQPNPGATMPPDSAQQSEVVLADSFISVRSGNTTNVFDFARRRRYVIDEAAKTYDEFALFDILGFRELELRNRSGMRKALAKAKLDQKTTTPLEDEHELSIQDGAAGAAGPAGLVVAHVEGEDEVFASGAVTLLRHSKAALPASPADAARFVQYLRYLFGGHPAVLAALQKEQQIPARLRYVFQTVGGIRTVDLRFAVRQADAPATLSLAGYAQRPPAASATTLDELVDRAWASRATLAANVRTPVQASIMQTAAPHAFDERLGVSEAFLATGQMPMLSDEQKQAFQIDPAVRTLTQATAAKDPNALRQAIKTLQMLRLQAQSRRYMLSLFEANDDVQLGDFDKARPLFAEVLQGNPAIAGAYKDIGDFYFRTFDTPRAWRCWEIARTLAPLYPTIGAVGQFERSLVTRFPEYFDGAPSAQKAP
jgi:tetratricopeptide (TPR) repeat protein